LQHNSLVLLGACQSVEMAAAVLYSMYSRRCGVVLRGGGSAMGSRRAAEAAAAAAAAAGAANRAAYKPQNTPHKAEAIIKIFMSTITYCSPKPQNPVHNLIIKKGSLFNN